MDTTLLCHHGIKGQKWGVRRYQNDDGSLTNRGRKRYSSVESIMNKKTGEHIYVGKRKNHTKNDTESTYDILNNGKKIGNLILEHQGDNLYVNWVDIKKSQRGKGYANSIMGYTIRNAKNNGYKTMTLEVPGNSPDARHVYEKHGFIADKNNYIDDVWGGLTRMKKKIY